MKKRNSGFLIAIVSVIAVLGIALAIFWPSVKNLVSGAQLYNASDIEQAYNDGYDDAKTNEVSYSALIEELNGELAELRTSVANYTNQISTLNSTVATLTATNTADEATIASLRAQIATLNETIAGLQSSIATYEALIEEFRQANQIQVTFKLDDNTVYDIQYIDSGDTVSAVTNPESTNRKVFDYWTVNNVQVDLANQTFSEDTVVMAHYTTRYLVTFNYYADWNGQGGLPDEEPGINHYVGNKSYYVNENANPQFTLDSNMTLYGFQYWRTVDAPNTPVDLSQYTVTSDIVFYANNYELPQSAGGYGFD